MALGDLVAGMDVEEEEAPRDVGSIFLSDLTNSIQVAQPLGRLVNYHVTEIRDMCPRRAAWVRWFSSQGAAWKRQTPAALRVTFDIGHFAHDWVTSKYLRNMNSERFYFDIDNTEVPVTLDVEGVTLAGSMDALIRDVREEETIGLELKTISVDQFNKMRVAKIDHRFQVYLYMLMTGIRKFLILYIAKQYPKESSPFKVFTIDLEDPKILKEYEQAKREMETKLFSIGEWLLSSVTFPDKKKQCKDEFCHEAINCFFQDVCYRKKNLVGLCVESKAATMELKAKDIDLSQYVEGGGWPFLDWI